MDVNNNGVKDWQERPLPNVPITLTGRTTATVLTDADGRYEFSDLTAGVYTISEQQPGAFYDGIDTVGTAPVDVVENDRFVGVHLAPNQNAEEFNFGEFGLRQELISKRLFLSFTPSMAAMTTVFSPTSNSTWASFTAEAAGQFVASAGGDFGNPAVMELYTSTMLPVSLRSSNGVMNAPLAAGQYIFHVAGESVKHSMVSVQVVGLDADLSDRRYSFTNSLDRNDVNQDNIVSPLDALVVINDLNRRGGRLLQGLNLEGYFIDVNDDGWLTPLDALVVINHLNRRAGEGEVRGGINHPADQHAGETLGLTSGNVVQTTVATWPVSPPIPIHSSDFATDSNRSELRTVKTLAVQPLPAGDPGIAPSVWDDAPDFSLAIEAGDPASTELAGNPRRVQGEFESAIDQFFGALDDEFETLLD